MSELDKIKHVLRQNKPALKRQFKVRTLGVLLKKRVDLVMKGSLKPAIGKYIMREVVSV